MTSLKELIPDHQVLLALEPEALGGYLLQVLQSLSQINYGNYWLTVEQEYPQATKAQLREAISAAWSYLSSEGLIGPYPDSSAGWYLVTKRGRFLKSAADIDGLAKRTLLRKALLHKSLQGTVYSQFLGGNYDLAVIQAFKEVEIAVKEKSLLKDLDGVKLMRAAFKQGSRPQDGKKVVPGPLTDLTVDPGEQEGLCNLFAGAMGWCRNPVHHRDVSFSTDEAMQLICFASYLLSILADTKCVPSRLKKPKKSPSP